jgi:hypothetical protein
MEDGRSRVEHWELRLPAELGPFVSTRLDPLETSVAGTYHALITRSV